MQAKNERIGEEYISLSEDGRVPFYRFGPGPFGLPGTATRTVVSQPENEPCGNGLCDICRAQGCRERQKIEAQTEGTPCFKVSGMRHISGRVRVHGAKNSVLPILAACVLCDSPVHLKRVPRLSDTGVSLRILDSLGCTSAFSGSEAVVDASGFYETRIPDRLVREMRSSVIFLGSVAARAGEASLCLPGGCELGARPVDLHLMGLRALGMDIRERGEKLYATHQGLRGAEIRLPFPSVGATENILLAAVCAQGKTILRGAAREPEIVDLCLFLRQCGANIVGEGSPTIYIEGVKRLHGTEYTIMPDRIEAATLLGCAAVTGGKLELDDCAPEAIGSLLAVMRRMGCRLEIFRSSVRMESPRRLTGAGVVETAPFPGFPTDAQPVLTVMGCVADGETRVREMIFESRFKHLPDLVRMGADIDVCGREAVIRGVQTLTGQILHARDLRGGAALVTAALAANGESRIYGLFHIDRGYERLEKTLSSLGADIVRIR